MRNASLHKWDQIREEIILLCVQWYVSYPLTYSQLKTSMEKRGFRIDPKMINNLIHEYSSIAFKRFKETSNQRTNTWRIAQIPFKIRGRKKYLYRALNAQGNTLDFMISGSRSKKKAKDFFQKSLSGDFKVQTQYTDKRKIIKRKSAIKLTLGTVTTLLFLFVSGSYAINLLDKQESNDTSQNEIDSPVQVKTKKIEHSTALKTLLPEEKAFLDTISWAEGTLNSHGYNLLFGGEVVEDLSRHPEKCIPLKWKGIRTCSTAFGRYQILDFNAKNMSFEPEKQDQWAINKLDAIGALSKIHKGDVSAAIMSSCKIWSSFPCHKNDAHGFYNQPTKSMNDLLNKYQERLSLYQIQ